jgi:hypothetical protein
VSGDALARRLLRLDAAYCAGAGALAIALYAPLSRLFEAPEAVFFFAGSAAITWALVLLRLARAQTWRLSAGVVAAANIVGAAAIGAVAAFAPALAGRLLLVAVAAEVSAFAVAQLAALRR